MAPEPEDALRALVEVVGRLRRECPWDREQSHMSLRPYLLEESHEVLEAIESGDPGTLKEELGDLLLQVVMHCAIAAEGGEGFDLDDVAGAVRAKMIHRHPHVFGEDQVAGADQVVVNWERLKAREKRSRLSLLDGVPRSLPALAYAKGLQRRPARIGFDPTPTIASAVSQLGNALETLEVAAGGGPTGPAGQDRVGSEGQALDGAVGDLLFAAVGLARRLRIDPEDALRTRSNAFARRFRRLEAAARAEGVDLHELDAEDWGRRWDASEVAEGV